jgi:hypothetical protein
MTNQPLKILPDSTVLGGLLRAFNGGTYTE